MTEARARRCLCALSCFLCFVSCEKKATGSYCFLEGTADAGFVVVVIVIISVVFLRGCSLACLVYA